MKFDEKILILFFVGYFILQLFLAYPEVYTSDESTHVLIGLFFRDMGRNLQNFHSINDVTKFATDFIIQYPKITPTYPPLYHFLLAGLLSISQSILLLKTFNILITILTAFVIYQLSLQLTPKKNIAIISSVLFLTFITIFYLSDMIMMDIFQVLTFSLVLFYYLKLKNQKKFSFKQVFLLSILLVIAFLTKFFSLFLLPIILIDSFFNNKKLFKYSLLAIIISIALISPYLFFYIKFGLYKVATTIASATFGTNLVYFDVFSNFGIFIGLFVALSIIWFLLENYRNPLILSWLVIPFIAFLLLTIDTVRYSFILMPLYAFATATTINKINRVKSNLRKKILFLVICTLIVMQLIHNTYLDYSSVKYSVNDLMKSIGKSGNVLIVSEDPVYSSVYILYGYLNGVEGNLFRPCILKVQNFTDEFLNNWGIKYLIDQENKISRYQENSLNLNLISETPIDSTNVRLFETDVTQKVDCNYVCILQGKVCKEQGFDRILELIHNIGSAKSD